MNDATKREGPPRRFRFSLRALLGVTVLGSALFGLTFSLYLGGGYTPSKRTTLERRGLPNDTKEDFYGDGSWFGAPFINYEEFVSCASWNENEDWEERYERTFQKRIVYYHWGIACNISFCYALAAGLWWSGGKVARRIGRHNGDRSLRFL